MKLKISILLFSLIALQIYAQESKKKEIEKKENKSGRIFPNDYSVTEVLDSVTPLLYRSETVSFAISTIEKLFYFKEKNQKDKQLLTNAFILIYKNNFGGRGQSCAEYIINNCRAIDFDKKAIDSLKKMITENQKGYLLAGMTLDTSFITILKEELSKTSYNLNDEYYFNKMHWTAQKALARLGDKEAIKFIISKIKNINNLSEKRKRLHDISYIRQTNIIDFYKQFIISNTEFVDYSGSKPININFKYEVLNILKEIIIDFPTSCRNFYWTKEEKGGCPSKDEDIQKAIEFLNTNKYQLNK